MELGPGIGRAGPSCRAVLDAAPPSLSQELYLEPWVPWGWACGAGGAGHHPREAPAPGATSSMAGYRSCLHPPGCHPPGGERAAWCIQPHPPCRAITAPGMDLPPPRAPAQVQGPRAHLCGTAGEPRPLGAALAAHHLLPGPQPRFQSPSRTRPPGPSLQGLVRIPVGPHVGKNGGGLEGPARPALMNSTACHQMGPERICSNPDWAS